MNGGAECVETQGVNRLSSVEFTRRRTWASSPRQACIIRMGLLPEGILAAAFQCFAGIYCIYRAGVRGFVAVRSD